MTEEIAAEKRGGRLLVEHLRLPAMGYVRRRNQPDPPASQIQDLAVVQDMRRAVGEVVDRDVAAETAVDHPRLRSRRQPLVHRSAFVGLDVAEADPPQALDRHQPGQGARDQGKQGPGAAVEEQGLVGEDQELIEAEAIGRRDLGYMGRQAEDAVADLVDPGLHWPALLRSKMRHPAAPVKSPPETAGLAKRRTLGSVLNTRNGRDGIDFRPGQGARRERC
jgi:hypothetical protein